MPTEGPKDPFPNSHELIDQSGKKINFDSGQRRYSKDRKTESTRGWKLALDPDKEAAQHVIVRCENCNVRLYDVVIVQPSYNEEYYKFNCPACGDSSPLTKVVGEQISGPIFDEETGRPIYVPLDYETVDRKYHKITLGKP